MDLQKSIAGTSRTRAIRRLRSVRGQPRLGRAETVNDSSSASVSARGLSVARQLARAGFNYTMRIKSCSNGLAERADRSNDDREAVARGEPQNVKRTPCSRVFAYLSKETIGAIVEGWLFPLYGLNLTEDRTLTPSDLKLKQREAEEAWMENEFGYRDSDCYR